MTAMGERLTPQQYLAMERAAEFKNEFFDGEVVPMNPATYEHALLVTNLLGELVGRVRPRGCEAFASQMRVWVADVRDYLYPDVVVVCGKPRLQDDHSDTLLNPVLVVEVLSPWSEKADRGRKWDAYRTVPSLRHYVLVEQEAYRVEAFTRRPDGEWTSTVLEGLEAELVLDAIGCTLTLADVYEDVPVWRAAAKRSARVG